MNIFDDIQQTLFNTVTGLYSIDPAQLTHIDFSLQTDAGKEQFGDISTNIALMLSKTVKSNPRQVAQHIIDHFKHPSIEKIEIAGPGFINLFPTLDAFKELAHEMYRDQADFFKPSHLEKKRFNIEYVSANPTGPLHIGHGRGGIIGDVLSRVLTFIGHTVTREFYINDAGVQIQKLGTSLKIRIMQQLGKQETLPEDAYQGEYLIELARTCIEEYGSHVIDRSDSFFSDYAKMALLNKIKDVLTSYNVPFDVWFSEKTLHASAIKDSLEKLEKTGDVYRNEDALWLATTRYGDDKDRVVQKASGEYTYVAPDIAYIENKLKRPSDHLILILGQDHHGYVGRLKAIMQALGHNPDALDVILYQLVTIKESGQTLRLSKRAGRIVTLEDVVSTVGKDVARFFYLNKKADAHLDFDIDLALKQTDENPVFYIQYAYVRTVSILKKAREHETLCDIEARDYMQITAAEKMLLKKIASLRSLLVMIGKTYHVHALSYYTVDLAQSFHSYYNAHKVIDPEHVEQSRGRLFMVNEVKNTLHLCFDLLGISAPESM